MTRAVTGVVTVAALFRRLALTRLVADFGTPVAKGAGSNAWNALVRRLFSLVDVAQSHRVPDAMAATEYASGLSDRDPRPWRPGF